MSPEAWASSAVTHDCVSGSQAQPLLHSSFKEYEYVLHAQLAQVTKVLHTAVLLLVVASDETKKATANTATLSVALENFMVEGGWLVGRVASSWFCEVGWSCWHWLHVSSKQSHPQVAPNIPHLIITSLAKNIHVSICVLRSAEESVACGCRACAARVVRS